MTAAPVPEPPPPSRRRNLLRSLLLWAVLIALFYLLFRKIPLHDVIAEFQKLSFNQILALSGLSIVFILGVSLIDGTAMWYGFLSFRVKMPWQDIVLARTARMVLDSVASLIGQAGLGAHIVQRYQVAAGAAAGMVMFLFLVEIYGMIALSSLAFPILAIGEWDRISNLDSFRFASLFLILAWPGFLVLYLLGQKACDSEFLIRLRVASVLHPFQTIKSGELIRLLFIKTCLAAWQISLTVVAFRIFRIQVPPLELYAFMPLTILVSSLPITPARLGTTQWSWVFFFGHLVPEPAALVAFSLLLQFVLNVARWIIGAASLFLVYRVKNKEAPAG